MPFLVEINGKYGRSPAILMCGAVGSKRRREEEQRRLRGEEKRRVRSEMKRYAYIVAFLLFLKFCRGI